jgi:hypothetical protein
VTERSPFGNGDPFLYGDPHIEMGIRSICFPIWKWGSNERLHFHMGMCLSPFPYGNHHMETGSRVIGLPIWKRGFTLSIWGCFYPRFYMAITIWKRGTISFSSLYGNRDHHMEMGISKGCVNPRFHMVIAIWKRGAVSFSSIWKQ